MSRRAETDASDGRGPGRRALPRVPVPPLLPFRPDVAGSLDGLLGSAPCFRSALRGYDRLEVDNYVAWAESEIATAHRETDDLMSRYAEAAAELDISRRLLARSSAGQEMSFATERIGRMLSAAADEAADITAAAAADAERILAEARADADARLRKAHEIKEHAVAAADSMRGAAAAELQRAREESARQLAEAAERIRREKAAADAAAAAQLAALHEEVQELRRRGEEARAYLHRLTDQIGEALDALAGTLTAQTPDREPANFVVDPAGEGRAALPAAS